MWSDAPGRALLEYDRVLLYLLALVVLGAWSLAAPQVRLAQDAAEAFALAEELLVLSDR